MSDEKFSGPLFIVGMPRSGTKLIRDLLNQNPRIGIPAAESHFIPKMIREFGANPNFHDETQFARFLDELKNTTFYLNMKREGQDILVSEIEFVDRTSWQSVLESIFRFYAPRQKPEGFIWGDKTPGYLRYMDILKDVFPKARFLHIIRDPRDYSISVSQTWKKSMLLAAEKWRRDLEVARSCGSKMGSDYKEVFYEDLLEDAPTLLGDICLFLDCEFTTEMLSLGKAVEQYGDARGQTKIIQDNKNKYFDSLSPAEIKRIEEVVYPAIQGTPYELVYGKGYVPLKRWTRMVHYLYDGWASVLFHAREKGILRGLTYFLKLHQESKG